MPCVIADRNLTVPGCRLSECGPLGAGFLMAQEMPLTVGTRGCSLSNEPCLVAQGVGILFGRPLATLDRLS